MVQGTMVKVAAKPLIISIDDEATILRLVQLVLEPLYTVLTFLDTDAALKALQNLRPDLIICDITMPGIDGFALHTLLRDSDSLRSVPFIYLTALADRDMFRRGMLQGADDYLVKPFSADELREAVNTRLARTRALREPVSGVWAISSLGGVGIIADGKVRDFNENKKGLELFLYLLCKGKSVMQSDVARDLWPEPIQANTLRVLLNRARKTFEGLAEFLVRDNALALTVLRPCTWDAEAFEHSAKDALAAREETMLEQALRLYQGSFLPGFHSPWSEEQRDYYEGLYLQLLEVSAQVASSDTLRRNALHRLQQYLGMVQPSETEASDSEED
jgi:two-component SAPR family response regulator